MLKKQMPAAIPTKPLLIPLHLASLGLGLLCSGVATAAQINWGNAFTTSTAERIFCANGEAMTEANGTEFTFSLGTFGNFVPTSGNVDEWMGNWKPLQELKYQPGDPSTPVTPSNDFYTGGVTLTDNSVFATGENAYLYVYRTVNGSLTEVALLRRSISNTSGAAWRIPKGDSGVALPLSWRLSGANTIVYGGANNIQSAGEYDVDPGVFNIQLHYLPNTAAVPEPSVVVLAAGAIVGFWLRRRRF
jgi:hypothetical protein